MDSFSRKPTATTSFDSYKFDFGLGSSSTRTANNSSSSRPLRDTKPAANPQPTPISSSNPSWTHIPAASKPSWTHQPASAAHSAGAGAGMVGDIFGKTWTSAAPAASNSSISRLGINKSDPNLFSDLLGPALGSKPSSSAPLKSAAAAAVKPVHPAANQPKPAFSMGGMADSLPMRGSAPMNSSAPPPSTPGKDPFESLSGFRSKPSSNSTDFDAFGAFKTAGPAKSVPQPSVEVPKYAANATDMFFQTAPAATATPASSTPDMNDWDFGSESTAAGVDSNTTTELEGLPPPPAGVTSSVAKSKGMDNYKQGQYADAIKWLSWAVVLLEANPKKSSSDLVEVLSCRASSYKEVGEYKKAIADCSKVLEGDKDNVAVLLQRALLYESSEKYRLGAEDLRMVLKIDPSNRLAKSTIHRVNKLAD